MKHLKLFEDFKEFQDKTVFQLKNSSRYEKLKDLPFFGYCKVDDEQSVAVQVELLGKGYNNFPDYSSSQKYYHNVVDPKGKNLIVWNGKRKEISLETFSDNAIRDGGIVNARVYYGYDGMATPPPFELIEFNDYFKPKPGYEGHFHGKQYGI
jgi:hypothetical protein